MKTTIKALLLILALTSIGYTETKHSCSEKDLKALKTNFDETYKNYKYYSKILGCYDSSAMRGDVKAISSIMDLYNVGQQNAEFTEWYFELIANLFVKYPAKFLDVLMTKDQKTIDFGMNRLKSPFIVETEAISGAAKKIVRIPKYKKLAEQLIAK